MDKDSQYKPRRFHGVMVSSTFTDLQEHRAALIKSIKTHGMTDIAMENDSAKLSDVIDSSLQMVRDGAAYIAIISKKYGQVPKCPVRNPNNLSITELEFDEAAKLGRPILLFIMSDDHLIKPIDIEPNAKKQKQLKAFADKAKKMAGANVQRIYATFDSLDDFKEKIASSVAQLNTFLGEPPDQSKGGIIIITPPDPIPKPPVLYAEPPYIGSHDFVGRAFQLETLNDWAKSADSHSILLFEAIGGNGKSMLTWEWTEKHAINARKDWAGIFWYSFYERGAIMTDFCQRALAYMTEQPLDSFRKKKAYELKEMLLHQLKYRPWLLILDGLERVLVAYHRVDAAMIADEELNAPTDIIVKRDPCGCINDEDDDLLRALAVAYPSKVLISTRLIPKVLINKSNHSIPGVRREPLPGLRPADAEQLFRNCGVTGSSEAIQSYLTANCDCHPLTVGVLAGLVTNYFPDKGNFDAWVEDLTGGKKLNLASLDLIQRRNHILKTGFDTLSEKSRQLLSAMSLISESVNYEVLKAINPHLPSEPDHVEKPSDPQKTSRWIDYSDKIKKRFIEEYEQELTAWKAYEQELKEWTNLPDHATAPLMLQRSISELDQSGLLQYDKHSKRYDLHPVVRSVAKNEFSEKEKIKFGLRAVNHFETISHSPYNQAQTLDDLGVGINIFKTFAAIGYYDSAFNFLEDDLADALFDNLEEYNEILRLCKTFFPNGWGESPYNLSGRNEEEISNIAAIALCHKGQFIDAFKAFNVCMKASLNNENYQRLPLQINNLTRGLFELNRLGTIGRTLSLRACWGIMFGRMSNPI